MEVGVSIHAPREGCDGSAGAFFNPSSSFNSRTPGGVRRQRGGFLQPFEQFQFTHPGRGATLWLESWGNRIIRFNSRTPGGVRPFWGASSVILASFNSRTPGGVRPEKEKILNRLQRVSIHAPREGCDGTRSYQMIELSVSIHAPREGCDRS